MFIYILSIILIMYFIKIDGPKIVKNEIVVKYNFFKRCNKINKMLRINYRDYFNILWISINIIFNALWISFIQYINKSVIKIGYNKYLITYVINGKTYRMIVDNDKNSKNGKISDNSNILLVYNENGVDLTSNVISYYGPKKDWHGDMFNSEFFSSKELNFEMSNGDYKVFKNEENILL